MIGELALDPFHEAWRHFVPHDEHPQHAVVVVRVLDGCASLVMQRGSAPLSVFPLLRVL